MMKEDRQMLRMFLQYGGLILLVAAYNFYNYYRGVGLFALVVGLLCVVGLLVWIGAYLFYFRIKKP